MTNSVKPRVHHVDAWLSEMKDLKEGSFGTWRYEIAGQKMICDDETLILFGIDREDWDETLQSFFARLNPDDIPAVQTAVQGTLSSGHPYDIKYRVILPDGTDRLIHALGKPFYDENDKPVFVAGCCREG